MRKFFFPIICITFFCVSFVFAENDAIKSPQQKIMSSPNGRYVFSQVSEFARHQYMLDTQTGRLWQIVHDEKDNNKLQPVPYIQILGDEAYIPDPPSDVELDRKFTRNKTLQNMK